MKQRITISFLVAMLIIFSGVSDNLYMIGNAKNRDERTLQDSIINFGLSYLNTPYRYGAVGPGSFDCSGFTSFVFRQFGYDLDHDSRKQASQTTSVNKTELQKGDLVFFEGRRRNGVVGHVGIVLERKEDGTFNFIHASVNQGVTITSSDQAYYASRYLKGGRIANGFSVPLSINNAQNIIPDNDISNGYEQNNEAEFHIVEKGENLKDISKKYDIPIATLKQLNGLKHNKIKKGTKLKISEGKTEPLIVSNDQQQIVSSPLTSAENNTTGNLPSKAQNYYHTDESQSVEYSYKKHRIQKGETLFAIAKANNLTIQELKKLNKLSSDKLSPGQTLIVDKKEKKKSSQLAVAETSAKPDILTDTKPMKYEQTESSQKETAVSKSSDSSYVTNKTTKHKVAQGETLYDIARKNNLTTNELKQLNGLTSDKLTPGQILTLKRSEKKPEGKNIAENKTKEKQKAGLTKHTVKAGETLFSIRRKYGCSLDQLKKWNNLSENTPLQIGQKLVIYQ
ncbi:MAG: LysM peptidoglycan-binding domain-containing protein [Paludibacteraceae bacterium]